MSGKKPRRTAKASQVSSQELEVFEGPTSNEPLKTPDKKKKRSIEDISKSTKLPTPTRRSARLRGAPVEFSGGEIDQLTRSRSRSRSKSATPTPFSSALELGSNVLSLETINESPPVKRRSGRKSETETPEQSEPAKKETRRSSTGKASSPKKASPLQSEAVLKLSPEVTSTVKSPVKIDFNQSETQEDSANETQAGSPSKRKASTPKQPSKTTIQIVASPSNRTRRSLEIGTAPDIDLTSPSSPKKLPKKLKESIESLKLVQEVSSPSPSKVKKSITPAKSSSQKQKHKSPTPSAPEILEQPDFTSPEANSSMKRKTRDTWPPASPVWSTISNSCTPPVGEVTSKLCLSKTPTIAGGDDKSPANLHKNDEDNLVETGSANVTPSNKNQMLANDSSSQLKSPLKSPNKSLANSEADDIEELMKNDSPKCSPRKNILENSSSKSPQKSPKQPKSPQKSPVKYLENTTELDPELKELDQSAYFTPPSGKKQRKSEQIVSDFDSTPREAKKSASKSPKKATIRKELGNESAKTTPGNKKKRTSTSTALSITPPSVNKTIETPTYKVVDPLKEVENHVCDDVLQKWAQISSGEELFCSKDKLKPELLGQIKNLYAQTTVKENEDLPAELVGQHQELIWQQIARKNKKCFKDLKSAKEDLKDGLDFCSTGQEKKDEEQGEFEQEQPASELEDELEDEEDGLDEKMDDQDNEDEEVDLDDEEGADLFNLKEEDLKDLDEKLEELAEGEENEQESTAKQEKRVSRKRKTRTEYEEDILDEETVQNQRKKRFKPSSVDDKFFNLNEMNQFLQDQDKIEEKRRLGKFDGAEEMTELMEGLEEENLQPRSWDLAGEVTAGERAKDELLDRFIDVDFRAKSAPIITTDTTAALEAIIVKRIKDKSFDDVVRKVRQNESLIPMSNRYQQDMEDQVRKSLADVYEDEFKDKQKEDQADQLIEPQLDPAVESINKDLNVLFKKLDALSHYQFTPQEIAPEIKIVKNMPSFQAEEVGPLASTQPDAELLAPEEVFKRVKSAPKAKEERSETDKKRERRHKKKKQKVLAAKGLMNGGDGNNPSTSKENIHAGVIRGLEKSAENKANAKVFKKKKSVYSKRENKEKKRDL